MKHPILERTNPIRPRVLYAKTDQLKNPGEKLDLVAKPSGESCVPVLAVSFSNVDAPTDLCVTGSYGQFVDAGYRIIYSVLARRIVDQPKKKPAKRAKKRKV